MRRFSMLMAVCLSMTLTMPTGHAWADTVRVDVIGPLQGIPLTGVCPFPVTLTDRDTRTVTSYIDETGRVVRQTVSGGVSTELRNEVNGIALLFATGALSVVYHQDPTATVTQKGSGLAYDQGTATGTPGLVWFSGKVVTRGVFDDKSLTIQVSSQTVKGRASDVCDMLVTGLKTRH